MKKVKLLFLLALLLVVPLGVAGAKKATLFHPITNDRVAINVGSQEAQQYFADDYILEMSYGYVEDDGEMLGYSIITNYYKYLSQSMSATQTTIPVTSLETDDGHTITMADLGDKVFLIVDPDSDDYREIIMCEGITGTAWSSCTRGLNFYGTSTASITANKKTHNSGAIVIITNTHYVFEEFMDKDTAETIGGDKTFTGDTTLTGDLTATGEVVVPTALSSADDNAASIEYVNNVAQQGAATSTESVAGISELATRTEMASSTDLGADSPLVLQTKYATSSPDVRGVNVVVSENDGYIDSDWLRLSDDLAFSGENTFSATTTMATTTINGYDIGTLVSLGIGGDDSDGALTITTGTTTIDCDSKNVLIKNYSSISITGDGALAFSNTHTNGTLIIFNVSGDVTITSSKQIYLYGAGASGGSGGAGVTAIADGNNGSNGNDGQLAIETLFTGTNSTSGLLGAKGMTSNRASGGSASSAYTLWFDNNITDIQKLTYDLLFRGASGASGGGGGSGRKSDTGTSIAGGDGGDGGGSLIIFSGGALNFTGTINADGGDGGSPSSVSASGGSGGGGGGAGGNIIILTKNITANTGTITANGGDGGTGGDGSNSAGNNGGGGGASGGASLFYAGGAGGLGGEDAGDVSTNGTAGGGINGGTAGTAGGGNSGEYGAGASSGGGGGGGGGGAGYYLITEF